MTATTFGKTVADQELPQKKSYAVERARFPLVFKLFGLTALLILIVVGLAIGITIQRANRVANQTVNSSITAAAKLFRELEQQRLQRLRLPTVLIGYDSSFAAYIENALAGETQPTADVNPAAAPAPVADVTPQADLASIADQIEQRRTDIGNTLALLLDADGQVVVRSDRPTVSDTKREPLEVPLVTKLLDDLSVESNTGILTLDGKLYHAAIAPIGTGTPRRIVGYLINADALDDAFANSIARSTNAGVAFVARNAQTLVARSSNAPSVGMGQMDAVKTILTSGRTLPATRARVDNSDYVMTGEPLRSGTETAGAAVFLRSRDRELAPFREIEQALLIGGGIALLLAFISSWIIAKRVTRPIEELAGMAQAVTAGDYSVQPSGDRGDEVGILGRSFAQMISSLRDKAELEELFNDLAAKSEEREAVGVRVTQPAKLEEGTVLVTDLRGLPPTVGEGDAASVIQTIAHAMKLQEAEVARQDGRVREIVGHRLVSVFHGERGIIHAIRAARAINEELASLHPPMALGVGIATGEFVTGSVDLSDESGLAIVGNAPLLALVFAWHAPNGHAYISYDTAQAAGGEVLSSATREEVRLKWLQHAMPVASLPLVSATTGLMRAIGGAATQSTLKMDSATLAAAGGQVGHVDLPAGALFANRYRIESVLGRGGMGVVYKANDTQLDEVVAIKTLPGSVMQQSSEDLERFKREIRLARKITHRNVLRTYDYGEAEGVYFISMEFVRGYTLAEALDQAPGRQMAPRLAVGVARQISRGLQAAHEQGIIHRDIKPGNVLIDPKGEVKLMDFGIARMAEAKEGMTQAGLIVGTPHYMSPEQVQGKLLDARSDVYSMGVLLWEMVIGRRPFESSSLTGVLTAHITEAPKPPIELRPEIGAQLNAVILRALAKEPKQRYEDAGALLAALDQVQAPAAAAA